MLLPKFDFHEPKTVDEACQMLSEIGSEAKLIAGGTDVLVNMKKKIISPPNLISVARIEGLGDISSNGALRIGCQMTAAEISQSELVRKKATALAQAAGLLGSPLVRNRATVAGNVVTARPAADMALALLVFDARAVLQSKEGSREVMLKDFFKGPGITEIRPDELLTELILEEADGPAGSAYIKLGTRKTLEISLINVAVSLILEAENGPVKEARVALGAVAPTPMRAFSAEKVLIGARLDEKLMAKAAQEAAKDSRPIDDFRGSAEYRRWMVEVLTKRALKQALENARN